MALRVVAIATAATGIWYIVSRWFHFQNILQTLSETASVAGMWLAVVTGIMMLIAVLKVGVAVGLWRAHRWAWCAALFTLAVDSIILVSSVVRFHLATTSGPDIDQAIASGATNVEVHSIWPTYFLAVVSMSCLLVLLQKSVRKQVGSRTTFA